jgi:hypothetical protein
MPKFTFDFRAASVAAATANNAAAAGISGLTNRNGAGKLSVAASGSGFNVGRYDNTGNWYSNNAEVDSSGGTDGTDQYIRAILPPRPTTGDYKSFGLMAKGHTDSYLCGVGAFWQNSAGAGTVPNLWIEVWLNTTGRTTLHNTAPSFSGGWNPTRWHAVELHVWLDGSVIKSQVKSWQAGAGFTPPANGSSWNDWIAGMGTVVTQNGANYTPSGGQVTAGINTGSARILQSIEYHYSSPPLTPVDYAFLEVEESAGVLPLSVVTTADEGVLTATASDAVGAVSYQWHGVKNSLDFTPGAGNIISGATSQTYTPNPPSGEIWGYRCVVTDSSTPTPQTATTNAYPGERAWPAVGTLPAIAPAYTAKVALACFGDSISEADGYQSKLRALLQANGVTVAVNIASGTLAASGSNSSHWLGNADYDDGSGPRNIRVTSLAAIDSYRAANPGVPVIATMLLDTNDIQTSQSLVTTRAWLELLKSEMDSRGIPLIVAAPPWDMLDQNHGHRTLVYRGDRREHAASLGLIWAAGANTFETWRHRFTAPGRWDYFAGSEVESPSWFPSASDLHPNALWEQVFAQMLYESIRLNVIGVSGGAGEENMPIVIGTPAFELDGSGYQPVLSGAWSGLLSSGLEDIRLVVQPSAAAVPAFDTEDWFPLRSERDISITVPAGYKLYALGRLGVVLRRTEDA